VFSVTDKNGHQKKVYVKMDWNDHAGKGGKVEEKAEKKDANWYTCQLTTEELKEFIDEARKGKDTRKAFVGTVMPEARQRIKAICGKDVKAIILESSAVRHAYSKKNHNLEDNDLTHIIEVINTATGIELSDKSHQDNIVLTFKKDINGELDFVEEVRMKHNGQLALVTCYRPKKAGRDPTHTRSAPEA
jgi:hypothetical protein